MEERSSSAEEPVGWVSVSGAACWPASPEKTMVMAGTLRPAGKFRLAKALPVPLQEGATKDKVVT